MGYEPPAPSSPAKAPEVFSSGNDRGSIFKLLMLLLTLEAYSDPSFYLATNSTLTRTGRTIQHIMLLFKGVLVIELLRIPLENRPGQLYEIVTIMSTAGIDMKALSLTNHGGDASEVLLLVTNLIKAQEALKAKGRSSTSQPAIVVEVDDHAGGLASVLEATTTLGLSINDLFTFVTRVVGKALAVVTFEDNERAEAELRAAGVKVVNQKTITNGP